MRRYDFRIIWSDHTWTDGNPLYVNIDYVPDGNEEELALDYFIKGLLKQKPPKSEPYVLIIQVVISYVGEVSSEDEEAILEDNEITQNKYLLV